MPFAASADVRIYYEEAGTGTPILFVHEYGGDWRSWEAQLRHFSRGWRCITMSARGYPPSDCPDDVALYGQHLANRDVIAVLDALAIDRAHLVGLSMGAYTALMCAIEQPGRIMSVTAAGAGSGSLETTRDAFIAEALAVAELMEHAGRIDAEAIGSSPTRVQLRNKDPRGWAEFVSHLAEHPPRAAANVLRQIQARRPSLYRLEAGLSQVARPVLLIVGDEDEPCLDVNLWMKRIMPSARLAVFPGSGHAVSLEEPGLFNALVERFIVEVERGVWRPRDPAAAGGGVLSSLGSRRG